MYLQNRCTFITFLVPIIQASLGLDGVVWPNIFIYFIKTVLKGIYLDNEIFKNLPKNLTILIVDSELSKSQYLIYIQSRKNETTDSFHDLLKTNKMSSKLLTDVHDGVQKHLKNCYLVCGKYDYYHYLCDGFDDRGWGCGYRTLQTICSWMNYNFDKSSKVPSIIEIQNMLVEIEDKPKSFLNSRQWIGSFEVCLVLDKLYDIPSKIVHVKKEDKLEIIVDTLKNHFEKFASPIMMGGDVDCSSKGIMGVHVDGRNSSLLVVDPHYVGKDKSVQLLQDNHWVKWQPLQDFLSTSFYNLCLPQARAKTK